MLLTLKPPAQNALGAGSFHDYSPPLPPSHSRFSSTVTANGISSSSSSSSSSASAAATHHLPPLPVSNPRPEMADFPPRSMPPIQLPPPSGTTASHSNPQSMVGLPHPPNQWQGAEESMRNWLQAKSEEDRRRQEEEKTQQENLRLEQRKVEHSILRDSLQGGIPPPMVPIIFAGMSGGSLPNTSFEWAQHYMDQINQLQHQQQQQQHQYQHPQPQQQQQQQSIAQAQPSADVRPGSRLLTGPQPPVPQSLIPPNPYAQTQPPPPPPPPQPPQSNPPTTFLPPYQMSPVGRGQSGVGPAAPTSAPRGQQPQGPNLPRLNTGDMAIQQPPQAPPGSQLGSVGQTMHPLQQAQAPQAPTEQQQQQQASPLFIHQWQPPTSQSGGNPPSTPSDYTNSPKKRKDQRAHQAAPPPSSQPSYTSPSFSQAGSAASTPGPGRRRGHSRNQSDASSRGYDTLTRPVSRNRTSSNAGPATSGEAAEGQQQQQPQQQTQTSASSFKRSPPDPGRRLSDQQRRFSADRPEARRDREPTPGTRPSHLKRDDARD